jgi:hypothetical protein
MLYVAVLLNSQLTEKLTTVKIMENIEAILGIYKNTKKLVTYKSYHKLNTS